MVSEQYIAVVESDDYQRFREIVGDDLDWPETFEKWRERTDKQIAQLEADGIIVQVAIVDYEDFIQFCSDTGLPKNGVTFGGIAISQDWPVGAKRGAARETRAAIRKFLRERN